ncbi:hypothetical protein D9613_008122 [Agrocybe pediades]|uniref:DUF4139 domain-containing protein n=1 Tax=Agrocybe pediades TaxID=84607 RepID=A0A8H4VL01_9AGAR|nr:hypothetical protein D9613_008122 [Agrocybe pediades]
MSSIQIQSLPPSANTEILNKQRLNRPSTPHFTIYQPQLTWLASIANRVTGVGLSVLLYGFSIGYLIAPGTLDSAHVIEFVAGLPDAVKYAGKAILAAPFAFHSLNGIRHLTWDLNKFTSVKGVYQTGYAVLGLSAVSTIYLTFFHFSWICLSICTHSTRPQTHVFPKPALKVDLIATPGMTRVHFTTLLFGPGWGRDAYKRLLLFTVEKTGKPRMTSPLHIFKASVRAIKSVTVFKFSNAEVVRVFPVPLKKGQNKVQITGLSSSIDTRSLRVSGLGSAARLSDVVCKVDRGALFDDAANADSHSSTEQLRDLSAKKEALESEKNIREQESELLFKYGQTLSGNSQVSPGEMTAFLDQYFARGKKILESITELKEKIAAIDRLIKFEEYEASIRKGSANGQVDVVISAEDDCSVDLKLTYSNNARWRPVYELHASADNGKPSSSVFLHYRAQIWQETGEDWNNTSLILSTAVSGTMDKSLPALRGRRIEQKPHGGYTTQRIGQRQSPEQREMMRLAQQQQQQQQQMLLRLQHQQQQQSVGAQPLPYQPVGAQQQQMLPPVLQQQSVDAQPSSYQSIGAAPGKAPVVSFNSTSLNTKTQYDENSIMDEDYEGFGIEPHVWGKENNTFISETPVTVSFSVHDELTIPSDGFKHQVSIAELPFTAKIAYITVPRVDPRVFLQCEVTNTSDYRLAPGPVRVIVDDSYVSTSWIEKTIGPGDSFECTLGDDPSTRVSYKRSFKTVKSETGAFSGKTTTTTHTTKISVHNQHRFPITPLTIREAVPLAYGQPVSVILRKPERLAEAKDGEVVDLKDSGLAVGWTKVDNGSGGRKEGKIEWTCSIDSGAQVMVEAEWDVKSAGDDEWMEGSFN